MLTAQEVRRRLPRHAAQERVLGVRGDHDLNPHMTPAAEPRAAAVLVPLVERVEGLTVLLTVRTAHLSAHAGQIALPGGGVEPGDRDAEATALRETEEEIGLPPERIELLGRLDSYVSRTGFHITPVVGLIRPPMILRPDPNEVAEVFETPLSLILHPDQPQRHARLIQGCEHAFWVFPHGERCIWGVTAGVLKTLRDALTGAG